jgi:hypothetical protein
LKIFSQKYFESVIIDMYQSNTFIKSKFTLKWQRKERQQRRQRKLRLSQRREGSSAEI